MASIKYKKVRPCPKKKKVKPKKGNPDKTDYSKPYRYV